MTKKKKGTETLVLDFVDFAMYGDNIPVIFCNCFNTAVDYINNDEKIFKGIFLGEEAVGQGTKGTVFVNAEDGSCIILLKRTVCNFVLAHEVFHAVNNILRKKGVVLSNDSEEAFAYGIGHVVGQIGAIIKQNKQLKLKY